MSDFTLRDAVDTYIGNTLDNNHDIGGLARLLSKDDILGDMRHQCVHFFENFLENLMETWEACNDELPDSVKEQVLGNVTPEDLFDILRGHSRQDATIHNLREELKLVRKALEPAWDDLAGDDGLAPILAVIRALMRERLRRWKLLNEAHRALWLVANSNSEMPSFAQDWKNANDVMDQLREEVEK